MLIGLITISSISFYGCDFNKKQVIKGNLIIQNKAEDFQKGRFEETQINNINTGEIQISKKNDKYEKSGMYTSEVINTDPFNTMLLSCNADTPEGTSVKVEIQVKVNGKWSKWLNWGKWGTYIKSGSDISSQEDDLASMDEDVLQIKGSDKAATSLKYKLTLETVKETVSPSIRMIAASLRNDAKPIAKIYKDTAAQQNLSNVDKVLNVPKFSQMVRDKNIAVNICSPTCIAMAMNYYGIEITPEESAWGVYDNLGLLFGNWAFNCAYAGSYGLEAYTDFFNSMDDIKREILNGNPVIASVKYKSDESVQGDLPVLHGAPIDKTEGHLVLVCGFTHENGKEYVVVNDPAAKDDNSVSVKYLASEFDKAWVKVVYVIHKGISESVMPRRINAEFTATGSKRQNINDVEYEYQLKFNNKVVNLSRENIKSILVSKNEREYSYIYPNSSKNLFFRSIDGSEEYKFIIVSADGRVYTSKDKL